MAISLPPQPWTEGMSFVVDETGLEYTFNGEVWVSEGQEIDLTHDHDDEYATIEYSDEKDAGLALRIDSLEHLTDGHEADLGGASWTMDDEVRESHFTTRKDDPSSGELVSDIRMFRQWLVVSKFPASGGDTDQWPIGNNHPSTLTVRSYDGWTATYSCGEQKNMEEQWEIDCYFQSTDAPEGTEWRSGSRYEIKMQAQDATLDETYASIGHIHEDHDQLLDRVSAGETAQTALQASVVTRDGEQVLDDGAWKVRKPNNNGGKYTYIEIDNDEMGLYHVKTPTNAVHAANKQYVDEQSSLGRPFVYGDSDLTGQFSMASSGTGLYLNMTDANGRVRRHRHAPDFAWPTELRYTIWDENGVLVHAGLTGVNTDYNDQKLQFKNCRPLYDMGLVDGTTYYVSLEGYW